MLKKAFFVYLFAYCLIPVFSQTSPKACAIEINPGYWLFAGLEFEADFNFGVITPVLNGLALHAGITFPIESYIELSERLRTNAALDHKGIGGGLGVRYYFGDSGIHGFYVGISVLYYTETERPLPPLSATGVITSTGVPLIAETGYRFLFGNFITLTLGGKLGFYLYHTSSGGITGDFTVQPGTPSIYPEITIALGIAL